MFVAGWAIFMSFCFIAEGIGGEAFHGKIEEGHYYVANHYLGKYKMGQGQYKEVSPAIFHYSRIHAYAVLVTFPLGLLAGFVGYFTRR